MKKVKTKHPRVPESQVLKHFGSAAKMIMRDYEIRIYNTYDYYLDIRKTSDVLNNQFWYTAKILKQCSRKVQFLFALPSLDLFTKGYVTQKQFLEVPIEYHRMPNRLYYVLLQADVYCLQDVVKMGMEKLKTRRGFGVRCYFDVLELFDRKGLAHLLE